MDPAISDADEPEYDDLPTRRVTPNQLVGYNMAYWRKRHGITQDDLGVTLVNLTHRNWSKATVSAAERSWDGKRIRQFDTDEMFALSAALQVPIAGLLLLPPNEGVSVRHTVALSPHASGAQAIGAAEFLGYLTSDALDDPDPHDPVLRHFAERFQALLDMHFGEGAFEILSKVDPESLAKNELRHRQSRIEEYTRAMRQMLVDLERESTAIARHLGEEPMGSAPDGWALDMGHRVVEQAQSTPSDAALLLGMRTLVAVMASDLGVNITQELLPMVLASLSIHDKRPHEGPPVCRVLHENLERFIQEASSHREPAARLLSAIDEELDRGLERELVKEVIDKLNEGKDQVKMVLDLGLTLAAYNKLMFRYGVKRDGREFIAERADHPLNPR